jgi:hypothetical protein
MVKRIIASTLLVVACTQLALAQELPKWAIPGICAKASAPGQCALFEGRARNAVSGSWGVLPETVKRSCLAAVKNPLDQSWRLLGHCIEAETLKGVERRAVATAATPADPVPRSNPSPSPNGEPAPLLSPPAEPSKAQ